MERRASVDALRRALRTQHPLDVKVPRDLNLTLDQIEELMAVSNAARDARVPKTVLANDACIVCFTGRRHRLCSACVSWAMCETCWNVLERRCPQCVWDTHVDLCKERMALRETAVDGGSPATPASSK